MKKFSKKITRAVSQINRSVKNSQKLRYACGRHRDVFAVYPQTLDMLPVAAKNILLSHDHPEEEFSRAIPITTPGELQKFFNSKE